jgi:hypothetical protein
LERKLDALEAIVHELLESLELGSFFFSFSVDTGKIDSSEVLDLHEREDKT